MAFSELSTYGRYAFLAGFVLVILNGFLYYNIDWVVRIALAMIIALIGIATGFIFIKGEEEINFLVGVITLLVIGSAGLLAVQQIKEVTGIEAILPFYAVAPSLGYIGLLLGPAAVIVSLRIIFRATSSVSTSVKK